MKHTSLQTIRDEHASLAAMLRSMRMLIERGPGDSPQQFFDVLRAMLFYIDEFPERLHHTKESELLFPCVLRVAPELEELLARLDRDHQNGEKAVRELQHLLLAWELLGESRMATCVVACQRYLDFYLEHMQLEETVILPEAERLLSDDDWRVLDAAFKENTDPLGGKYPPNPAYDRLFTRIVLKARIPVGLGDPKSFT
ncbi:MAG: hemerythrin domain-containing protein [Rhodoferax sp.]|nr:hemerythrin domain-containing protein [Rhodoferax sp.]